MKHFLSSLIFLFHFLSGSTQSGSLPPYLLEIEVVLAPNLPAIHSFAKAQSENYWLLVAGRIDGLHGFYPNSAFPPELSNQQFIVIDTNDWSVYYSPLTSLPYELQTPLYSTNTEFFQDDNYLYVIGGYGYDSVVNNKITFASLTAIAVNETIQEVLAGGNNFSPYVRQITDSNLAITGGKLEKIGSDYFLVGGHNFSGLYTEVNSTLFTQEYTNSISRFNIIDDGTNLSVSNFIYNLDTANYHRRDLNTSHWRATNGEDHFILLGGVFQYGHDFPWLNPVHISSSSIEPDTFEQQMSQYTCPVISIYDSVTEKNYFNLFGGMSWMNYVDSLNQLVLDTLIPFINDITTITLHANGTMEEIILPLKFPVLCGSNMEFFPVSDFPWHENHVANLRAVSGKTLLGYLYGGIESNAPNDGVTAASNRLFRIFITPDFGTSANELAMLSHTSLFPNPSSEISQLSFSLMETQMISINIMDALGREHPIVSNLWLNAGDHLVALPTRNFTPGLYEVTITTEKESVTTKLTVIR